MPLHILIAMIFIVLFTSALISTLVDKYAKYTAEDLKLQLITLNNEYYFELPLSRFQYKKIEIVRGLYSQGAIVYCDLDKSTHIITRWGEKINGKQRFMAKEYLPQLNQIHQIKIINYGNFNLSLINQDIIYNLSKTIEKDYFHDAEADEALKILEALGEEKHIPKSSLKKLLSFLSKYEPLTSLGTNLISLIFGILGILP